jgi:hypothetical protein
VVSAYVLSRFAEPEAEVRELVSRAADETERLVRELARASDEVAVDTTEPAGPPEPEPGDSKRRPDAGGAQESPE